MILVWQFGSVALLAGLGALAGHQILPWPRPHLAVPREKQHQTGDEASWLDKA
jgi:hypothetical protein